MLNQEKYWSIQDADIRDCTVSSDAQKSVTYNGSTYTYNRFPLLCPYAGLGLIPLNSLTLLTQSLCILSNTLNVFNKRWQHLCYMMPWSFTHCQWQRQIEWVKAPRPFIPRFYKQIRIVLCVGVCAHVCVNVCCLCACIYIYIYIYIQSERDWEIK